MQEKDASNFVLKERILYQEGRAGLVKNYNETGLALVIVDAYRQCK